MTQIAPDLWVLDYDLSFLGMDLGRRVTIIRLSSGKLVIHSTAPFREEELAAIHELGDPRWLVDATHFHDTFSKQGRAAFPELDYLVPSGFPKSEKLGARPLLPAPPEWEGELTVIPIEGIPLQNEHAFYHHSSKSLIVADLIFNLSDDRPFVTKLALRVFSGLKTEPSVSRLFRICIRDKAAFAASMEQLAKVEAVRIIPGHGEIIEQAAGPLIKRLFLGSAG